VLILWLANYFIELFIIEETLESNVSVCKIHLAVIPAFAGMTAIIKVFVMNYGDLNKL